MYRPAAFACQTSSSAFRTGLTAFVEHASGDNNSFAQRFAILDRVACQVVVEFLHARVTIDWSGQFDLGCARVAQVRGLALV